MFQKNKIIFAILAFLFTSIYGNGGDFESFVQNKLDILDFQIKELQENLKAIGESIGYKVKPQSEMVLQRNLENILRGVMKGFPKYDEDMDDALELLLKNIDKLKQNHHFAVEILNMFSKYWDLNLIANLLHEIKFSPDELAKALQIFILRWPSSTQNVNIEKDWAEAAEILKLFKREWG